MKLSFFKPYVKYDVRFKYAKKRKLQELEAIILTIIYFQKLTNPDSNLINELVSKMNLKQKKWIGFLQQVISKMNNKEITYNHNVNFNELLLGDIDINPTVENNIKNNSFYGLDEKEQTKDYTFITDPNSIKLELLLDNQNDYELWNLSNELKYLCKDTNSRIDDYLDKWFSEMYESEILKESDIQNRESNENIVFLPISYESSIDFNNKTININNKDFYELYQKSKKYNFLDQMFNRLQQDVNKLAESNGVEFTNFITDINEFDDIRTNLISQFNEFNIDNYTLIVYNGNLVKIGIKYDKFLVNTDFYEINFPIISYQNLNNHELEKIWNENLLNIDITKSGDDNPIELKVKALKEKIYDNLKNNEQKELINKLILSNYKVNFSIPSYKSIIIDNVNKIDDFDITWIFGESVDLNEFKQIYKNTKNQLDILKNIKNHFYCSSSDKINFLFDEFSLSYNDYFVQHDEIQKINKLKSTIDNLLTINDIDEISLEFDKIHSLLNQKWDLNENKNYITKLKEKLNKHHDKLIRNKKDDLVKEIYKILENNIIGGIDDYLTKKCPNVTNKTNGEKLDFCVKNNLINKEHKSLISEILNLRNKFAHEGKEKTFKQYKEKSIKDLNDIYQKLKKFKEIMEN